MQTTPHAAGSGARPEEGPEAATPLAAAAAATSPNRIVQENQLPGSPRSEWDIQGAGSSNIEGFATDISVDNGSRIDFKIRTSSTNYRIDVYRLGYYGGMGARKVTTIQRQLPAPQSQPNPIVNASIGLVDAGNWNVSASWTVPADAVSGVYIAKLVRQDGTPGENHIPFVVRDDGAANDIVFQTADTTWQAYNSWGGYSLYGGNTPAGRAYKVSYNRPFVTRAGAFGAGSQDWVFDAEYPTIRWLEQNGYNVGYVTGVDTDRRGSELLNDRIFLSNGHDEYWSGRQRANVEAARDAGVNLAFFSGNEVFWKTRWENAIDGSATPYRTLVSYKETKDGAKIDPSPEWTGTWRDPRFSATSDGGRPENALTGQLFMVNGYRFDAMRIPYEFSRLRFWRDTAVAALQPGQSAALPAGYLGYEWDAEPDNGFRPAGLVPLSSTTLSVDGLLQDHGNTYAPGTATHALSLYRAPSGALVFGAGTTRWGWGLDADHDGESVPADPRVQQATLNLFADMGVLPATLQPGRVMPTPSTDTTPATSTILAPGAGATLTAGQAVTITGTASDSGGRVAVVEVSVDGGATWKRATGRESWSYSWVPQAGGAYTIRSRAVDDSVNVQAPTAGVQVTVSGPSTVGLFPSTATPAVASKADPGQVELGMRFQSSAAGEITGIRFYKPPGNTAAHVGSLWSSAGTRLAQGTFQNEGASGWQTLTFAAPVKIAAGATYVASYNTRGSYAIDENYFTSARTGGPLTAPVNAGVYGYGAAGTFPTASYRASNYWVDVAFRQTTPTANAPPTAANDSGFSTARNTALTLPGSALTANDSDPDGDPLTVTGVSGASNGTVALNAQTGAVTFTPAANHTGTAGFAYTVSDGRGGAATASVSLAVTDPGTATPVSFFPATATPAVPNKADPSRVELGMRFQPTEDGQITGVRFYKGSQNTGAHVGSLWSSTGVRLAQGTFQNEGASGWQTLTFAAPVSVRAGTTYVASYNTQGSYSIDESYFTSARTSGPLTAPANAGVYGYGAAGTFPTASYRASNYWVDVLFQRGQATANRPPAAVNDAGYATPRDAALTIPVSSLLANDSDPDGDALAVSAVGGAQNGTVSLNTQAGSVTFAPAAGYTGPAAFTYTASDGRGGSAAASVSVAVQAPATGATASLFPSTAVPANPSDPERAALELGVRFSSSQAGEITGVRFYKGGQNTGTHVGSLWSSTGARLAQATFQNESASGWQTVTFATPVRIAAGATYVASYSTNGGYAADAGYFTSPRTSGPLTAPANAGVYAYGAPGTFPAGTYDASNYWVDVVFQGQLAA